MGVVAEDGVGGSEDTRRGPSSAATPDASEDELALEMAEAHGIRVSPSTVNRTLRRLNLT